MLHSPRATAPAIGASQGDRSDAFSRTAWMAVRRALHALRDGWQRDERFADAARRMVDDAQAAGLTPERTLAVFKRGWRSLPEVRLLPSTAEREAREQFVRSLIDSYYDDRPDAEAGRVRPA